MKVLLKNANVIFVDSETISKNDILVENGLIKSIGPHITCHQDQVETIDCENKWIMPGLIDMHVHIKDSFAPLFTAAGITTVRNTSGSILELEEMMYADGSAKTPRVITSDRLIDGPPGLWGPTSPYSINIDDIELAKEEVTRQVQLGGNLIKVYGLLKANIMEAVCKEARKENIEVSCDLIYSTQVNALEAAKLGVSWLEHASGILQMIHPEWSMKADEAVWNKMDWNNFKVDQIKSICKELLKYHVKICPTLTLYDQAYLDKSPWKPNHAIIGKIEENKGLVNQWNFILQSGQMKNKLGVQNKLIKTIAKIYHSIGGIVVCGTDTPAGVFTFPGMALHRELELFVESGFTEFETLKASTIISANAMNRKDLGRISEGKVADLIVLNSNPIESISNTQDILYVLKGGKIYTPQELIDEVPTEADNQVMIKQLIKKFEDHNLSVDMF